MATGHASLTMLCRSACRAVMSGASPLVGEASSTWGVTVRGAKQQAAAALQPVSAAVFSDAGEFASASSFEGAAACKHSSCSALRQKERLAGPSLPAAALPARRNHSSLASASTSKSAAPFPPSFAASYTTSPPSAPSQGDQPTQQQDQQQQQKPAAAAATAAPVQNPLQAAIAAAAAEGRGRKPAAAAHGDTESGVVSEAAAAAKKSRGGRREPRTWLWYDEADERAERLKERQTQQYGEAGTTYMLDVPQSMKKMDRIVKLVRGLSCGEALAQCQLVPHKAAKFVVQALEKAYEDATEDKGLNGERLVVDTVFVTKGVYMKGIQPMGRGMSGRNYRRRSHLRVVLKEVSAGAAAAAGPLRLLSTPGAARKAASAGAGNSPLALFGAFTARQVDPLMSVWSSSRRGPAGAPGGQRERFAYRVEV